MKKENKITRFVIKPLMTIMYIAIAITFILSGKVTAAELTSSSAIDELLVKIPQNVQESFKGDDGTISITTNKDDFDNNVVGTYSYDNNGLNAILLLEGEEYYAIYHEVGHYVDKAAGKKSETKEFDKIYKEEATRFEIMTSIYFISSNPKYAVSNSAEYFASIYNNSIKGKFLTRLFCPKSYAYVKMCEESL